MLFFVWSCVVVGVDYIMYISACVCVVAGVRHCDGVIVNVHVCVVDMWYCMRC